MRDRALSMIWSEVPALQRRQLIILLGRMATRHLAAAPATEGQAYDGHRSALALGGQQDSGAASRSVRGGVRSPIHRPTDAASSGVDPAPIWPRRTRARVRMGTAPSTGH